MPKPLVDINGTSLISRIILSFDKTNLFDQYDILTTLESNLLKKLIEQEIPF